MLESDVDEAFARLKELFHDFRDALKNGRDDFDTIEANIKSLLKEISRSERDCLLNTEQCEFLLKVNKFISSPQARFLSRRERSRSRSRRESSSSESFVSSSSVLGSTMETAQAIANGLRAADGSSKSAVDDGSGAADVKSAAEAEKDAAERTKFLLERNIREMDFFEKERQLQIQLEDEEEDLREQQRKVVKEARQRRLVLEQKAFALQKEKLQARKQEFDDASRLNQPFCLDGDEDIQIITEKLKSTSTFSSDCKSDGQ